MTRKLRRVLDRIADARERHRERHRPSGFGFALGDRLRYLERETWDRLAAPASFFLRRPFLETVEEAGPEDVSPRYALVFAGREPVAAVVAQVVTVSADRLLPAEGAPSADRGRSLARGARRLGAGVRARVLVCGNLFSWGFHAAAFAPGADPKALWPAIAEALYRIRRAERLSGQTDLVLVKDVTSAEAAHVEPLRRFSYRPLETEPNMVLGIDPAWRGHEDYLASLDAKYRKAARKVVTEVEAAGGLVEKVSDLDPLAERLHALYLEVQANNALRIATLPARFFPALARAAGGDFRCTVVRRGEEILGFVTTVRDGDTAVGYHVGFDRSAAKEMPLYLRLLHAVVADAIELRCARLSLGRTALEPKARLGARPVPMHVWVRHRVPAMNLLVRGLLGAIPHAEAPDRAPFRRG